MDREWKAYFIDKNHFCKDFIILFLGGKDQVTNHFQIMESFKENMCGKVSISSNKK